MRLVIDISEEVYKEICDKNYYSLKGKEALRIGVINGTVLPKGHGRLGDLSKIYVELNETQIEGTEEYKGLGKAKQIVCDAPTIIEADTESEETETWIGMHGQITAPKGTFERIFNDADGDNDI